MLSTVLKLLFIGNSLTAANDLPAILESMGRGADGEARRAIARGGWSFVILQQGPSALPESRVLLDGK